MTLGFATVRVNLTALVIDGVDSDDLPDTTPLTATMTLTPMVEQGKMLQYNDGGVQKLKALTVMTVDIGADGDISHRGRDYVKVPAPTAADTNLSELQWQAAFSDIKYGATRLSKIDPIYFYVHPGEDINLADKVNVAPSATAVLITRGPRGYGLIDARDDAGDLVLTYESASGPVDSDPIPLPAGTPGPPGAPGSPGATTVDGLTDATTVGKAVAKAATPAAARSAIGALSQTETDARVTAVGNGAYAAVGDLAGFTTGAGTRKLAAAMQRALDGTGTCSIAVAGDSMSTAYTGAGFDFPNAWYRRLKADLVAAGYADGGSGWVAAMQGDPAAVDPRWVVGSGWDMGQYSFLLASSAGAVATFTSTAAGTQVSVTYGNTGNPFTVSIDGGAPVTVTPDGNGTVKNYVVSGLANTTHSVRVVGQQYAVLFGASVSAAAGLSFSAIGKYGLTAVGLANDYGYMKTTALAAVPAPDALIIQLGANDLTAQSRTVAQVIADLRTVRAMYPNADVILAVEPQTPALTSSVWGDYQSAVRALAAEWGAPVVDLHRRWGGATSAAALGFVGADNKHPNAAGQRDIEAAYLTGLRQVFAATNQLSRASADAAYAPAFPTTSITYDGAGNVATVTDNGIVTSYTYNPDGTVHTDTRAGVTRTYTYDGSGNLTGIAS